MKKLLPIILAFCLILLCACGEKNEEISSDNISSSDVTVSVPATEWTAQMYKVENISESTFGRPVIAQLGSVEDVELYTTTYGTLADLSAVTEFAQCDEAFFENNSLVVFLMDTESAAHVPVIDVVNATGITTDIDVTVTKEGESDGNTATWFAVIKTERSVFESIVYVYVY